MRGTQCRHCKYRGTVEGKYKHGDSIHCNYGFYSGRACLRRGPKGKTIDTRGENKEDCKMFIEGRPATNKCKSAKITKGERSDIWLD